MPGWRTHWQWHRDHRDPYVWYAWNIRFSERMGGLVFASFNHSAGNLDSAVSPREDWADWRVSGAPHSEFTNLETYRYLPELSRGTGDPGPTPLLEFTTVEVPAPSSAQDVGGDGGRGRSGSGPGHWDDRARYGGVVGFGSRFDDRCWRTLVRFEAHPYRGPVTPA